MSSALIGCSGFSPAAIHNALMPGSGRLLLRSKPCFTNTRFSSVNAMTSATVPSAANAKESSRNSRNSGATLSDPLANWAVAHANLNATPAPHRPAVVG